MAKVILQPAGGVEAQRHYYHTIAKNVPLEVLANHLRSRDSEKLEELYGHEGGPVWGVMEGGKGVNKTKWERIEPGDIVLFSGQKLINSKGIVTYKLHSPELARELWGTDEDGETWEYIYFLKDVTAVNIPYEELQRLAPFSPGYNIPGFNVLNQTKSNNLINGLRL